MEQFVWRRRRKAFGLIELLVVIAILGILAAIATVSFLDAQARAKVARVKSDMRTLASGLEAYRVDANVYPPAAIGDMQLEHPLSVLTSPVAHITTLPTDPFGPAPFDFNPGLTMAGYSYKDERSTSVGMPGETFGPIWRAWPDTEYFLHSPGPNRVWDVMPYVEYDATNGAVSHGDICRFGPM